MPQNIGPELRLARPRTHTGMRSRGGNDGLRKRNQQHEDGRPHIELLEYEWPDLPPIINMKDAVTRKRVSQGIAYILPVDKGKNSINSKFSTNLRAMFHEPYATESSGYDDKRQAMSAKFHFRTNAVDTKWTRKHTENITVVVNKESENARTLYARSAPAGGRSNAGLDTDKLRPRSSLFLPVKAKVHPEAVRLRKEVEKIIKGVQEDNDEYDQGREAASNVHKPTISRRKSSVKFYTGSENDENVSCPPSRLSFTASQFETYEQLKNAKPPKPIVPDDVKSEYLSSQKNQEIWEWLHYGESMTDFQYFLTVCG